MRLITILLFLALATPLMAQTQRDIQQQADLATVYVEVEGGSGSGFVIGEDPDSDDFFVVTNNHVIEGVRSGIVAFGLGDRIVVYPARVVNASRELDLAILRAVVQEDNNHRPAIVPIYDQTVAKGEDVFALGFPGVANRAIGDRSDPSWLQSTVTFGNVGRLAVGNWSSEGRDMEHIQHTATINPGNSGGPLFNYCGAVVGVNTAGWRDANEAYLSASNNTLIGYLRSTNTPFHTASRPCDSANPHSEVILNASIVGPSFLPIAAGVILALGGVGAIILFFGRKQNSNAQRVSNAQSSSRERALLTLSIAKPNGGSETHDLGRNALTAGVVIGRDDHSDIQIDTPKISREHARLSLRDRKLMLTDLGSTNGTRLDGKPLPSNTAVQVNTGSKVEMGGASIRLSKARK